MADIEARFQSIVEKLKHNNHKITPQRLAVAKILAISKGHPSVEEIYEQLRDDFPTMSLATVYRNVILIKSLGEVLELGFPDGRNRYDGNKPYSHPHVVCVRCKKIMDLDFTNLEDMTERIRDETGFKILSHRLDFFGICRNCQQQNAV